MANINGTEIDLTPTGGMREEAERYRAWKADGEQGGTEVAATRASQILSGDELSPDTVITMAAWFARHEVDKQGQGFSQGEDGYPSPGRVAWAAWGGDPGQSWSDRKAAQIKAAEDRNAPTDIPATDLRAAPDALSEGDFVSWQSSGGVARGRIEHVMREGTLGVPDSSFSIEASAEDPAALIRIYRPKQDGWSETETLVGHKFSTLRKIEPLNAPSDDDDDDDDDDGRSTPAATEQRPYPNEHAARILDPDAFDSFRRKNNDFAQGIDSIYGLNGDDPARLQALRFDASRFTVSQAKEWLSDNDYTPLLFEPAAAKSMSTTIDIKSITKEVHRREAPQGLRVEESTDTGLTFSFSSEAPVERWWGREVLVHDEDSMDLERMNDGGAWLWNHNRDVVLGVAEKAWRGDDRRLYVKTKWSPNTTEKGTEEYKRRRDIEAGITPNVSFAYEINEIREAENGDMQVTKWNVLEVSTVSVPADQTVGLGRAHDDSESAPSPLTPAETIQAATSTLETKQTAERGPDSPLSPPSMEQAINVQEVQSAARQSERERVAAIRAMCDQHQVGNDLAERLINDDSSIDQAREAVLSQLGRSRKEFQGRVHDDGAASLGLTEQEIKRYSLMNVIRHLADPTDRSARDAAGFELECSKAAENKHGRAAKGVIMPWDVMAAPSARNQSVGAASHGGYLVETQLLTGSFIDLVRNRSALLGLNVTTLTGLVGNVDIPKKTGNTTAYWVGEDVAVSETQVTLGQLSMTPKSLGGFVDITRRLMMQQSMDVESMVRADLAESIALAIDSSGVYGLGGSSALLGIKNVTGVGTETLTSVADTNKAIGGTTYYFGNYSDYVNMETTVSVANLDVASMFYVGNAHVRGALKQTLRNTNSEMMIWENNEVNGYGARVSNQLIGSNVLFGDFSQAIFGFWSGVDITVDPYTNSTKGTTRIVAFQDVDFGLRNPAAFVFASGNA